MTDEQKIEQAAEEIAEKYLDAKYPEELVDAYIQKWKEGIAWRDANHKRLPEDLAKVRDESIEKGSDLFRRNVKKECLPGVEIYRIGHEDGFDAAHARPVAAGPRR